MALGEEVTAEVRRVDLEPGDAILLCSDGLYRYFDDDELCGVLSGEQSAAAMCQQLVATANERGGRDNITAVVGLFGRDNMERGGTMVEAEVPMQSLLREDRATEEHVTREMMGDETRD